MNLQSGSTGPDVLALQKVLKAKGFDPGDLDGNFGPMTEGQVKALQLASHLPIDGVYGTATAAALASYQQAPPAPSMTVVADASFAGCLAFTLLEEGGWVDDPADPGGATNKGITLRTLEAYQHGATVDQLRNISPDLVSAIYRRDYWTVMGAGNLPDGVNCTVFDAGVNIGPARSVMLLQTVVGVTRDGQDGALTQAAAAKMSAVDIVTKLGALQRAYYQALPGFPRFGHGWLARTERRVTLALKMIAPTEGTTT